MMTVQRRQELETRGGWLPLYVETKPCVVTGATVRCFYCGFGSGHDYACRYLDALPKTDGKGMKKQILVPSGGLPPSRSIF
jgi:hypothetical protein